MSQRALRVMVDEGWVLAVCGWMDAFLNELLLPLLKGAVLACALWLLVWAALA